MRKILKKNRKTNSEELELIWRQSTPGIVAVFVFTAFINVLKLAVPLYVFQLLDRVLSSRSLETLIVLTTITVAAVIAVCLAEIVRRWLLIKWGIWIEKQFGTRLFISGLAGSGGIRSGKSLRDLSKLRSFLSGSGATAWLDVIFAPLFIAAVYMISPMLALIILFCIIGMLILGIANEMFTRDSRSIATTASTESQDWIATAEQKSDVIGTLNIAKNLADIWKDSSTARLEENFKTRINSYSTIQMMKLIQDLGRIAIFGMGIWLVISGELSVGGIIAAGVLGRMAASLVRRATSRWRHLKSTYSSYCRVRERLTEQSPAQTLVLDRTKPQSLILEDLAFRYNNQSRSLFRRINLTVEPGQILNIVGQSGTGKSTFSRIFTGYLPPRSGIVRLGDVDLSRYPSHELSSYIGYLHQDTHLFPGTIGQNIAAMKTGDVNSITDAAKIANIHETIINLPEGYDTILDDVNPILSGSEQKRIALARAFYGNPPLIVLDEPEAHLDRGSRSALLKALKYFKTQNCIIIVTSQSKIFEKISEKLIVLQKSAKAVVEENNPKTERSTTSTREKEFVGHKA